MDFGLREEATSHVSWMSGMDGHLATQDPSVPYLSWGIMHLMVGNFIPTMTRPVISSHILAHVHNKFLACAINLMQLNIKLKRSWIAYNLLIND